MLEAIRRLERQVFPLLLVLGGLTILAVALRLSVTQLFWMRTPFMERSELEKPVLLLWAVLGLLIILETAYGFFCWRRWQRDSSIRPSIRFWTLGNGIGISILLFLVLAAWSHEGGGQESSGIGDLLLLLGAPAAVGSLVAGVMALKARLLNGVGVGLCIVVALGGFGMPAPLILGAVGGALVGSMLAGVLVRRLRRTQ